MFKKILFPTDFSPFSRKALPYLKGLKKGGKIEVVLLHVIDERDVDAVFHRGGMEFTGDLIPELERKVRETLWRTAEMEAKHMAKQLEKAGIVVRVKLERGAPAAKILEVEKEEKVDAVLLTSHGRSNVKGMLFGSVSEKVIRHCSGPVIVIKK